MKLKGSAYIFGNDINTDLIISGRYKFAITDMKELSKHIFEDIDPNFYKKLEPGKSIIVAGNNFGMGSSREQAPLALKSAGIVAVVANSFARIFYRNAFNIGLPLIETNTKGIKSADDLELDLSKGTLLNVRSKKTAPIKPLPKIFTTLLSDGGIVNHFKKNRGINL
ncbi:3-isopropylmalate dehydratase [Candidatus Omnitrophota bacterium]